MLGRAALLALLCTCVAGAPPARAAWPPDGLPVTTPIPLDHGDLYVATDGRLGTAIVWNDEERAALQKLTDEGEPARGWTAGSSGVPPAQNHSTHALVLVAGVAADGEGGMYIALREQGPYCGNGCGAEPVQLCLQHVTSSNVLAPGWPAEGVRLATGWLKSGGFDSPSPPPALTVDRRGITVAWRAIAAYPDGSGGVRTQRVSRAGDRAWGDDGFLLARSSAHLGDPAVADDGRGGAFVFWADSDSVAGGVRVVGQHVSAAGTLAGPARGASVSRSALARIHDLTAIADDDGALVAWSGAAANGPLVAYVARVDVRLAPRWPHDVRLAMASGEQSSVELIAAQAHGAIAAWLDDRDAPVHGVYAQRLLGSGRRLWGDGGRAICTAPGGRHPLAMVSDQREGAYLAWGDGRPAGAVFATRVTDAGRIARGWPADGAVVARPLGPANGDVGIYALGVSAARDGRAMVVWNDRRPQPGFDFDAVLAYAMLLTPHGVASADTLRARRAGPVVGGPPASPQGPAAFALRGVQPNPAIRDAHVRFALPSAASASLALFDIAGRSVWTRDVGALGAGEHVLALGDGAWFPPGVYLVRLRQGEQSATVRIAIVR